MSLKILLIFLYVNVIEHTRILTRLLCIYMHTAQPRSHMFDEIGQQKQHCTALCALAACLGA